MKELVIRMSVQGGGGGNTQQSLPTSRKVGRLPVKIPLRRCMVVVGGSATNFANRDAPPCGTSQPARVIDAVHAGMIGFLLSRHTTAALSVLSIWLHRQSTGHVYESQAQHPT